MKIEDRAILQILENQKAIMLHLSASSHKCEIANTSTVIRVFEKEATYG